MMPTDSYERIRVQAGATLFSAGEIGCAAYLIEAGCLEVFLTRDGGDFILAQRGPGEIIGEMALLDRQPRSASVRATTDCSLVVITDESVARRLEQLDPILGMCLGVVLARYRDTLTLVGQAERPAVTLPHRPDTAPFAPALKSLVLEQELHAALARSEFALFFQPIVRLEDGALAGFETLMRWQHPAQGLLPPSRFIPPAEASGFITELTDYAIDALGRVLPDLVAASVRKPDVLAGPLFVTLNVSGQDLGRASLPHRLSEMIGRAGVAAGHLKLEVTESALMKDVDRAIAVLDACRGSGIGIAIDDFGTGYSSLSYLSTLPITTLKIDHGFVQAMMGDPRSRRIVQTIIRLADELAIPVVAEGVEDPAEADLLEEMGCIFGQGYLFGRPAPLSATLDVVRMWSPASARPREVAVTG